MIKTIANFALHLPIFWQLMEFAKSLNFEFNTPLNFMQIIISLEFIHYWLNKNWKLTLFVF